jgi:outer membrane protein TolC
LNAKQQARAIQIEAERIASAEKLAREQQAKAELLAQEQKAQAEQKARAQQALAEQQAAERLALLSAKAEQERLAAVAARSEELKQLEQAETTAKAQADKAAKSLTAKQQARADKMEAERVALAEKLAREQQAAAQALAVEQQSLAARQAKAEADKQQQQLLIEQQAQAEQERLDAIAKTVEDNRKARAQVVAEVSKQVDAAAQLLQSKQQARAKQVEAERMAAAEKIALEQQQLSEQQAKAKAEALALQALAEQQAKAKAEALAQQAMAEKKAAEAKKEAELKQAKQARDAEDLKRMAELQKQAEEIRVSLANIKQQQSLEASNAKSAAKAASEQVASENLSAGEANFIKQNKLTELVESMGTVSQGKDKAATQALPVKPPTPTAAMESGTDMNWTSMPLASDLPPQIAKLGESFIDTVYKQLPSSKKIAKSMPFDEFKLRIKEAIDTSPDIAVVSNLAEQSKSSKSLALSSLLPQVTGNSDSGKRSIKNPWLGTSYDQDGSNFGVTVSQLVFDFGAGIFGLKAGKARVKAAEELLVTKKSEQALKSINAFIELERAREQYKLASQNAQSRLELIKLVKERFALGGGTKPDVIRAESRYAEALSSVALASSRVSAAEANYRELFASNPAGLVVGPDHEFAIEGLDKSAEQLAGTYPGLLQLARLKDATSEESKAVIAKTLPSFSLVYSGTSQGHFVSNVTPSASQSLVLQLSVPIYNGGADQARKDDARLKALQSELEFDAAMRSFEKTLLQSQAEVRSSDEIMTSRSVSVRSAIASMRAVREQFAFNKGTLLDLISVQDSLYQAGKDMIDASADRNLARYRLAHLTSELHKVFQLSDSPLMVKD